MGIENEKMIQPENFIPEETTAWSFPVRGKWATHDSNYRGNFAPQIARNLILKYSSENDIILDPMVGSGTTLIEARLLHRNAYGIDINSNAIDIAEKSLDFEFPTDCKQKLVVGDARTLVIFENNFIDLIILHPPYLNIIKYSENNQKDLSCISSLPKFCTEIEIVAKELYRVLKPGKYCCVLIGDTRKAQHYVPLSYHVLQQFLKVGFILKEEIIKAQHNCSYARRWGVKANQFGFYLIMHEHLFVFRKPNNNENLSKYKWSMHY